MEVSNMLHTKVITAMSLYRLKCSVQTYDWGKDSKDSLVAKLIPAACGPDYKIQEGKKYAEVSYFLVH